MYRVHSNGNHVRTLRSTAAVVAFYPAPQCSADRLESMLRKHGACQYRDNVTLHHVTVHYVPQN
jgi:hypothetical protein